MSRKNTSKAEQTQERILAAAGALFAAQGYAAASTRALASAAGVNIATLAYHFGGKEGLYHAVLNRMYERLLALPLDPPTGDDAAERIRQTVTQVYRWARRHSPEIRLILRHTMEHGALPEAVRDKQNALALARLAEIQGSLGLVDLFEKRLELLSMNHLIARYAASEDRALDFFLAEEDRADPRDAIAAHLAEVACRLLL